MKRLLSSINNQSYASHIYGKVFTLSNKNRSMEAVEELRHVIESLASDHSYEVPLLWYKLKETMKKTGKNWMVWSEVRAIGEELGIRDEDALKACLEFFHTVGDLYFDPISSTDFVALEPQWLINQFREVITIPKKSPNVLARRLRPNAETPGIFNHESLKNVWPQETVDALIAIMKRFALMFCLPGTYKFSYVSYQWDETNYYIVPSLLPSKNTDEKKQQTTGPPVMLLPRSGFLPVGMTSCLIATLINQEDWTVVSELYRNSATFCPRGVDSKVTVTLTQKAEMIEVTGNQLEPNNGHLLTQSLETISTTLCKLNRRENFTGGIYCSSCPALIHVDLHGSIESFCLCPHHGGRNDPSKYGIWFTRSGGSPVVDNLFRIDEPKKRGCGVNSLEHFQVILIAIPFLLFTIIQ